MTLIDSLIAQHQAEPWQDTNQSGHEIRKYYNVMLSTDRIISLYDQDVLWGFVEYTRLNFSQLGYIMISGQITPDLWDENGIVIFVSDLYINPRFKSLGLMKHFKNRLIRRNPNALYLVGQHQGKRLKPFSVHRIARKKVSK